jgi:hypothetical protein
MFITDTERIRTFKARHSLYKQGLGYDQQGAIYFTCKNYFTVLTDEEKERFRNLAFTSAKRKQNNFNALFEYLTGNQTTQEIANLYNIDNRSLWVYIQDFYLNFSYVKKVY